MEKTREREENESSQQEALVTTIESRRGLGDRTEEQQVAGRIVGEVPGWPLSQIIR